MIDNYDEIMNSQMVKDAKEKLKKQEEIDVEEDLYADFKEEAGIEIESEETLGEYSDRIQSSYNEIDDLPNIENQTLDDEYYEEQSEHPDIDSFEELVCPGGPLKSQVETWKKQFDKSLIHLIDIGRYVFVFRTLSRPEYKRLLSLDNLDALQREEIICHTTILFPANFDYEYIAKLDAGIPSTIADLIMEKSGFTRDYIVEVL